MERNIQMPFAFVTDVLQLVILLEDSDTNARIKSLSEALLRQIEQKLAAMDRRQSFTAYKTAPQGSNERETYRREYLDKSGIHRDWISDKEISV